MSLILTLVMVLVGIALLVPTGVLLIEVILGMRTSSAGLSVAADASIRACVLIPAHDEEAGIAKTLASIFPELGPQDRILVVADNCKDGTAAVARLCGAEVIERNDTSQRGKGYALAFGIASLSNNPPDVVIMIDADCVVSVDAIAKMKAHVIALQKPVQMLNLMRAPEGHEQRFAVAEFAWRIKNQLRPLGLSRLGLPCQLMGTGMGFPWKIARESRFASGNIVEDLELGVRMAEAGRAPAFYSGATVFSTFPISQEGEISQRRRWEGGSFTMLLQHGWATVIQGIVARNPALLTLGLDMLVPPLVLHAAMLLGYALLVSGICYLFALSFTVPMFAFSLIATFGVSLILAWLSKGRDLLPLRHFTRLLPFVLAKLRIHGHRKKGADWVRADRKQD